MESPGEDRRRTQQRRRFIDRVVALRGAVAVPPERPAPAERPAEDLPALRARVDHLEAALEGLQDATYHAAQRHEREIADLRSLLQPENLARSLHRDAARRGL